MTIPIRASEATKIEIRQALQRIEQNRRTGVQHNFTATADPTVDADESQGYSAGSMWYHAGVSVFVDRLFICTDATKGAAQWYNPFDGAAAFGAGATSAAGSGHSYGTVNPPSGDNLTASIKGDVLNILVSGRITITGDSASDELTFDVPGEEHHHTLYAGAEIAF